MKTLIAAAVLFSHFVFAAEPLALFDLKTLNSPVKEAIAKFELEGLPTDFVPGKVSYKIQNAVEFHLDEIKKRSTIMKDKDIELVKVGSFYQLSIPVSELAPGNYYLFLKVKSSKDKTGVEKQFTLKHKHSKTVKDYAMFVIDESMEVKDPGLAGEKTLAGIDSDKDGVRDDVQRWINEVSSNSKKLNLGMKQAARYHQLLLVSVTPTNKDESNRLYDLFLDKKDCMVGVSQDYEFYMEMSKSLRQKMENTKERIYAQMLASKHGDGTIYELKEDKLVQCEFNPDELPN